MLEKLLNGRDCLVNPVWIGYLRILDWNVKICSKDDLGWRIEIFWNVLEASFLQHFRGLSDFNILKNYDNINRFEDSPFKTIYFYEWMKYLLIDKGKYWSYAWSDWSVIKQSIILYANNFTKSTCQFEYHYCPHLNYFLFTFFILFCAIFELTAEIWEIGQIFLLIRKPFDILTDTRGESSKLFFFSFRFGNIKTNLIFLRVLLFLLLRL